MYVTEVFRGRPYQCFIPQPVIPAIDKVYLSAFELLDRQCKDVQCGSADFLAEAAAYIARTETKISPGERGALATRCLSGVLSRERISAESLKKIHASLTGTTNNGFRNAPVWMGAPHPALSWHVGSPPARLNGLIKQLVELPSLRMPASMQALIGLVRLLQIHPFQDGNGRTARLYGLWLGYRRLGPSDALLRILLLLTDRTRFDLNAASIEIQNIGRFDPLFEYVMDLAGREFSI